ncbi:Nrg2 protein [Saccharomycopsis crataegensis]|uniref:Nrg2 protein n=1 Tax=Saccharomycopsis crataegensis TaxID=43959 RepID=A0AAV5QPR7_9ASCO|nr:Nrg2 protein [Saccharomycopsis crataegensis]
MCNNNHRHPHTGSVQKLHFDTNSTDQNNDIHSRYSGPSISTNHSRYSNFQPISTPKHHSSSSSPSVIMNRPSINTPSSNFSPISPGASTTLGSSSVHFSPTNGNFRNYSLGMSNSPINNALTGESSSQRHQQNQYFHSLSKANASNTSASQLHSPVLIKSPVPDGGWANQGKKLGSATSNSGRPNIMNTNDDIQMKLDEENERKIIPGTTSKFGASGRMHSVTYTNPGIKYPRYSKFGENVSSSDNKPSYPPIDENSVTNLSSFRLPSLDAMEFSGNSGFPDISTIKDRHQSILSSTTSSSSCFSANQVKRSSYLTTSSLQTSIDRLSINQKDGLIAAIPEYASSDGLSDYTGKQYPSRYDSRPLPMPPSMYSNNNNSRQLSDMVSETSTASVNSNSIYGASSYRGGKNEISLAAPPTPGSYFNDGGSASSGFLSNSSPTYNYQQQHSPIAPPVMKHLQFQSPLPPLPSPQQQLQHQLQQQQNNQQQQHNRHLQAGSTSVTSKHSRDSKSSKNSKNGLSVPDNTVMGNNEDNEMMIDPENSSSMAQGSSLNGIASNPSSLSNYTSTIKFNSSPEEERKYQCKTCGRKFKTSGHVSRHSRIHTGERKHVCPFPGCGARFARHDNCMQHYKTHSNLNGKTAERMRNLKLKEQLSTKKMKIKALIW